MQFSHPIVWNVFFNVQLHISGDPKCIYQVTPPSPTAYIGWLPLHTSGDSQCSAVEHDSNSWPIQVARRENGARWMLSGYHKSVDQSELQPS